MQSRPSKIDTALVLWCARVICEASGRSRFEFRRPKGGGPPGRSKVARPARGLAVKLRKLSGKIRGSFSLPEEELERLQGQILTAGANLPYLLSALNFLYSNILGFESARVPFLEVINAIMDELDKEVNWGEKKESVRDRLAMLLEKRDVHERFRKVQRLQSGFIPNALSFSTFVDLRPDFGEGMEIKGYLPMIQFRISTDAPSREDKRVVLQMTEDALADLREALDRAEKKLHALKNQSTLSIQLIKT
jgi:hypothetical protein